ncbi:MAG: hypothetical protein IPI35_15760 [Deltaproteobacteria bacterium]|nr:hypothetical protein [Deltaproteobacteria bacterium]
MTSALLLALAACGSRGVEYELKLVPIVPANQSPFSGLTRLELVIEPEAGAPTVIEVDQLTGSPLIDGLGELNNVRIAVRGYTGDALTAFGRSAPLSAADGDSLTVNVLVSETTGFGWTPGLTTQRAYAAAAPDGQGSFYIFGGVEKFNNSPDMLDTIERLDIGAPNTTLTTATLGVTLPEALGGEDGAPYTTRAGLSATLLGGTAADAGKILLFGGLGQYGDAASITSAVALFDPATETFESLESALIPQSEHRVVQNQVGDVLFFGGWTSAASDLIEPTTRVQRYERATRLVSRITGDLPGVGLYGAATSLGADGVLYCGGATWDSEANWSPRDECVLITNAGELVEVAPMPEGRAHHAMVTVGEGLALVTGGLNPAEREYIFGPESRGTDTAWLYDASTDSWTDVGELSTARAWHVAAPLASGGAVIAGGYNQAGLIWQVSAGKAIPCAELYTVEGGLQPVPGDEDCAAGDEVGALPDAVGYPAVAVDPSYGVLLVGGVDTAEAVSTGIALLASGDAQ